MEDTGLISKKELLQQTGISYGQLYRWKRENLIPESWFIKKASFTGQETFFPRDKILKRMSAILELKDKYSLEELANIFSPGTSNRTFRPSDFEEINDIQPETVKMFVDVFKKERFSFLELTFIYLVSRLKDERVITGSGADLIASIKNWIPVMKNTFYNLIVCRNESGNFYLLIQQDAQYCLDDKTVEVKNILIDDLANGINLELNEL